MNLNKLQKYQDTLEDLSKLLSCYEDDILKCIEGKLITIEEANEIRRSLDLFL